MNSHVVHADRAHVWPKRARPGQAARSRQRLLPATSGTMSTQPLLQRTAGKRIALPVRVEPKVFFANERTCTSPWLTQSSRGSASP